MWGRFIDVFRRRRLDADLDAQLAHHLEALEAEYRAQGLAPDEARAAARRAVGGLAQVKDAYRDQHGLPVFETMRRNLRFALRGLRRTPGLTATVVLTLAFGIGWDQWALRGTPGRPGDAILCAVSSDRREDAAVTLGGLPVVARGGAPSC